MSAANVAALPGSAHRRVVEALEAKGCKRRGKAWTCPAHEDRSPSLSVTAGDQGVLVKCHAGCTVEDVAAALGLPVAALFDDWRASVEKTATRRKPKPPRGPRAEHAPVLTGPQKRTAEYVYTDRHGEPLARKVRLEPGPGGRSKAFVWEVPDGAGGWRRAGEGEGNPGVLYALPLVAEAEVVHFGEGEKAADALNGWFAEHGLDEHAATCAPTTAKPTPEQVEALRHARVVLWVDRDESGERQASRWYVELVKAGVSVETVRARIDEEKADAFDHLAAGYAPGQGDPFTLLPPEADTAPAGKAWPLLWVGDADGSRAAPYVVDDLIHAGTVGEVYGDHGTLKTMLALDLGAHVAQGISWRGLKTRVGGVVYVAAEGGSGIEGRLAALRIAHPNLPPRGLVAVRSPVDLRDENEVPAFGAWLAERVLPELASPVALLWFDTLSQSMPGGNENAAEDVTLVESNARQLLADLAQRQGTPRPAAGLVHHHGKDPSRGPRGHSSQAGNFDWLLSTERADSGPGVPLDRRVFGMRAVKVKDGPDGVQWAYRGELVEVGVRAEDGKVLCAPVVREATTADLRAAKGAEKPYTPTPGSLPARILDALAKIRLRDGPRYVPAQVVEQSGYGAELEERGLSPGADQVEGVMRPTLAAYLSEAEAEALGSEEGAQEGAHDAPTRKRRLNEALVRLEDRGKIRSFGGWLWLAE